MWGMKLGERIQIIGGYIPLMSPRFAPKCKQLLVALVQKSATCGSLNPQLWLFSEVNKDLFIGIIFGITEVFGPDGSFAAPAGFCIVTNGLFGSLSAKGCRPLP